MDIVAESKAEVKLQDAQAHTKCFLRPTAGRVIVERDGHHYSGKLVIPDTAKARPTSGHIIAIGPDIDKAWLGKRVLFAMFSGTDYKFRGFAPWTCLQVEEIQCEITLENAQLDDQFSPQEKF